MEYKNFYWKEVLKKIYGLLLDLIDNIDLFDEFKDIFNRKLRIIKEKIPVDTGREKLITDVYMKQVENKIIFDYMEEVGKILETSDNLIDFGDKLEEKIEELKDLKFFSDYIQKIL